MFSRLHIEPVGGVAGDMLLAALIDLGADVAVVRSALAGFHEPGLSLTVDEVGVAGERALYVRSLLGVPQTRFHAAQTVPLVGAAPLHAHHLLGDVLGRVRRAALDSAVTERVTHIFTLLAEAEAVVHGGDAATVGLHEVGELDSIMDVVGISVALASLGVREVSCAPLPSGHGTVMSSHGELACPTPAVKIICDRYNVPLEPVDVVGETVTPTGAAVVAAVCETFTREPKGMATAVKVGVGAGTKRFPGRANVVRIHGWR
ncbi:MAG: nickel insertion protein [Myxococcota bacterium]